MDCGGEFFFVLHQEHCIDAAVVFWVVGDLGVLAPHHLARCRDETKVANVHLNDSSLRDDTQCCIQLALRVLLHADYLKVEGGLQLRVRYVRLLEAECTGPDEALVFWGLAREAIANEGDLRYLSLPRLSLFLSCLNDFEHF